MPLLQLCIYVFVGSGLPLRYVGLWSPQLVAFTTWDLRRFRYMKPGRFRYVGF